MTSVENFSKKVFFLSMTHIFSAKRLHRPRKMISKKDAFFRRDKNRTKNAKNSMHF